MQAKAPAVYILASRRNGTLYVGVTRDLVRRLAEHRQNDDSRVFTTRYKVHELVHVVQFEEMADAIRREKQLKEWRRAWKVRLIEGTNPNWEDLSGDL